MGGPKLIESIDEGSAADEAAVFQAGDRILRLNDVPLEEMGPDEANQMLMDSADRGRVKIEVEFDIADAVVPTSGEFTLKLHRKSHQRKRVTDEITPISVHFYDHVIALNEKVGRHYSKKWLQETVAF